MKNLKDANLEEIERENEELKQRLREISSSITYKVAIKQKKIIERFGLLSPLRYTLEKVISWKHGSFKPARANFEKTTNNEADSYLFRYIQEIKDDEETKQISEVIKCHSLPILIYFPAVPWEPLQRPQHLLVELSQKGFFVFFCDPTLDVAIKKVSDTLYLVRKAEALCKVLQSVYVLVLVTWPGQLLYVNSLTYKKIWYDVLDSPVFLEGDKTENLEKHYHTLDTCDFLTFSNKKLGDDYIFSRIQKEKESAIKRRKGKSCYIPNGVALDDFKQKEAKDKKNKILEKIKSYRLNSKVIVGYVGAIDSWFDWDAIEAVSKRKGYEIVLVGPCDSASHEKAEQIPNLHLLGKVDYKEVPSILELVDICIIPFKENDITKYVTPIKFFEYYASGKLIVSSPFLELKEFQDYSIRFYKNYSELMNILDEFEGIKVIKRDYEKLSSYSWSALAEKVINCIFSDLRSCCLLSNFRLQADSNAITFTFYNFDGADYYSGGAERYLIDLGIVHKKMGRTLRVYQFGNYNWLRFYGDLEVVGIPALPHFSSSNEVAWSLDKIFNYENRFSQLAIYSPFFINCRKKNYKTIGISHGVAWDGPGASLKDTAENNIVSSAFNNSSLVSVDTNTCNWFQTVNFDIGHNFKYLPNYVDLEIFNTNEGINQESGKRIILYPRRLYSARGFDIVLDIMDNILNDYEDVAFQFVGKGFEKDTIKLEKKIKKWGNDRVSWFSLPPAKMYQVYKQADISLIPTMYSEGTSLSCLEALASGNAVIATRIGGLTDLIIDGFNGLLIEPNSSSLENAIRKLLEDANLLASVKKNARSIASCFSKEKWESSWMELLTQTYVSEESKYETIPHSETTPTRVLLHLKNFSSASEASESILFNRKLITMINKELIAGNYVFVVCPKIDLSRFSYKRLQFLLTDEYLNFKPEKVINLILKEEY